MRLNRKEQSDHLSIINSLYEKYKEGVRSANDLHKVLDICLLMHDEMNSINTTYKVWDNSKGFDHEGIYYIADFVIKHNLSDDIVNIEPDNAELRKKKLADYIFSHIDRSKKLKINIIEPHPDDAVGSASGLCFSRNFLATLHTISRVIDERDYVILTQPERKQYNSIKIDLNIDRHHKYCLTDLDWDCRKRCADGEEIGFSLLSRQYLSIYHDKEKLTAMLEGIVEAAKQNGEFLAIPLGIEHPMHMIVTFLCIELIKKLEFDIGKLIIYIDHPYDFQNTDTSRLLIARSYVDKELSADFSRYDDISIDQKLLKPILEEIYQVKHYAEFDGSLERTMCSYLLNEKCFNNLLGKLRLNLNNILYITAQAKPFVKTGGSGEVAYQYVKSIKNFVNDIRILMPKYNSKFANNSLGEMVGEPVSFEYITGLNEVYECSIEKRNYDGIIYYLLDIPSCFDNENPFNSSEQGKVFSLFCDAILQKALNAIDYMPTSLHCNDWQTALIPFLKKTKYNYYRPDMRIIYTIHFYGYKGIFTKNSIFERIGINKQNCHLCLSCNDYCELDKIGLLSEEDVGKLHVPPNQISFMKAGIEFSDIVSTVSKGYARELQHNYPDFKGKKVYGIRNGVNTKMYPFSKESGFISYSYENFIEAKRKNKDEMQRRLGFGAKFTTPIICMVSRLTPIKGIDEIKAIVKDILGLQAQVIIIGDDDDKEARPYQYYFEKLQKEYPDKFAYRPFSEQMEFETYVASDILLMPSRTEACGTTQINAMAYGVIPIVTMISCFEDTVIDYAHRNERKIPSNWDKGIGFYAYKDDCWVLLEVIKKALKIYQTEPNEWNNIVRTCLQTDFSWKNGSLIEYVKLYDFLVNR